MNDNEVTEKVAELRKRLTALKIPFVTIGRFKSEIHIYLKNLATKERILHFLTEEEKPFVFFDRV